MKFTDDINNFNSTDQLVVNQVICEREILGDSVFSITLDNCQVHVIQGDETGLVTSNVNGVLQAIPLSTKDIFSLQMFFTLMLSKLGFESEGYQFAESQRVFNA